MVLILIKYLTGQTGFLLLEDEDITIGKLVYEISQKLENVDNQLKDLMFTRFICNRLEIYKYGLNNKIDKLPIIDGVINMFGLLKLRSMPKEQYAIIEKIDNAFILAVNEYGKNNIEQALLFVNDVTKYDLEMDMFLKN